MCALCMSMAVQYYGVLVAGRTPLLRSGSLMLTTIAINLAAEAEIMFYSCTVQIISPSSDGSRIMDFARWQKLPALDMPAE